MKELLREVLSNPIAYYPILGQVMGLPSAIVFQQTMYWQKVKKGREFYKTDVEFAEELGIPLRTLRTSKGELVKNGFIKLLKKGYPAKSYYLIDDECLEKLASVCPKSSTSLAGIVNTVNETEQAEGVILYNTETTTETTLVGGQLPPIFGKDRLKRIIAVYSLLWFSSYGTKYQANFGAVGKNFKPLLDSLSEWQIAALMIIHFNWHGASGDDDFAFKKLEEAMHPILWIPSRLNEYGTYLTNVLKVDFFQNPDQIKEYVKTELRDSLKEGLQAGIIKNDNPNNNGKD